MSHSPQLHIPMLARADRGLGRHEGASSLKRASHAIRALRAIRDSCHCHSCLSFNPVAENSKRRRQYRQYMYVRRANGNLIDKHTIPSG